jgi:hypothetical protein
LRRGTNLVDRDRVTEAVSELARWIDEAKSSTRDTFAARHPCFFLLAYMSKKPDTVGFKTELAASSEESQGTLLVLPLVKAPGSPYADRISIGRAPNCDVVVRHASISKLHTHLRAREDGALVIVDVSARNPTLLDGKRVDPGAPPTLRSGMEIRLGDVSGTLLDARETHAALCRLPSPVRER